MTKPIQNTTPSYAFQFYQRVQPHINKKTAAVFLATLAVVGIAAYFIRKSSISAVQPSPAIDKPVQVVEIKESQFFASKTYLDNYREKGAVGDNGILDFCHVFSDIGVAYVADSSGSADPKARGERAPLWEAFNQHFPTAYRERPQTYRELKEFLIDYALALDSQIGDTRKSTLLLTALISQGQQKYVVVLYVGDSSLHKLSPKNNKFEVTVLTPDFDSRGEFSSRELGSATTVASRKRQFFSVQAIPVQSGDRIIGVTDGVTDALKGDELNEALINFSTQRDNNQAILTARVQDKIARNYETDAGVRNNLLEYDDIGMFEIVVP